MARPIDAKKIEQDAKDMFGHNPFLMGFILRWIRKQPTIRAAKVAHGLWVKDSICGGAYVCSECGGSSWYYDAHCYITKSRFCPNCGTKMDLQKEA